MARCPRHEPVHNIFGGLYCRLCGEVLYSPPKRARRLGLILTVLAMTATPARADCATTVRIWMYTARAQSTCLFRHYDEGLISRSHQCGKTMTQVELETAMTDGSRDFDYTVSVLGQDRACEDILKAFSNVVQR